MHRFLATFGLLLVLAMYVKAMPVPNPSESQSHELQIFDQRAGLIILELIETPYPEDCDEGDKILKSTCRPVKTLRDCSLISTRK